MPVRVSSSSEAMTVSISVNEADPQDAWLPLTESRNGNLYYSIFHLVSSGIGFQALILPVAFATLGWTWGAVCLSIAFAWQLYTMWLLVQLHESVPGTRFSRFLHLAMHAFGPKLGKLLAMYPVMYLSGGSCVQLIITGGTTMRAFFQMVCGFEATKSIHGVMWFLIFGCMANLLAHRPNLNSVAWISCLGGFTGVGYCISIWALSFYKGRPDGISHSPLQAQESGMERYGGILHALGFVLLAFRGHNVVLEIQGTLPSRAEHRSRRPMWKAVTISYALIALCIYPLAIGGYWSYGNMVPYDGMLSALEQFHGNKTSEPVKGLIYSLVVINCLCSFQVYAMVAFDNLEFKFVSIVNRPCPQWYRTGSRFFFGGLTFLLASAFPFLPRLAPLIGGVTLPLTFAYPCLMWIRIKKPQHNTMLFLANLGLGCLGVLLSLALVIAALWNFSTNGLKANFFNP